MKYYSTNQSSPLVLFKSALIRGQAPDGGLYMPEEIPSISKGEISSMKNMFYADIAFLVTSKFLRDEISENRLKRICEEAYNFEVPLEKVTKETHVLRMDRGPTASFKDFAARMLARLMQYFKDRDLLILTATSGDTGGAVANAFYGLDGIRMVVLFPASEVSETQRKQMTTLGGNITALAVKGKFDDCQAVVKRAFLDPSLKSLNLSSANSINFGRLLPQTVYYFYAYSRIFSSDLENIVFSVPSGNFGNLTGGLIAKRMGLPVDRFIAAVNENDEFPRYLESGEYEPVVPSRVSISNAMNVGNPSNLERIMDLYGDSVEEMNEDIFAISISDKETRKTIKEAYRRQKIVLEPHGAVGWAALKKYKRDSLIKAVCFETAHPAKFPKEIEKLLGFKLEFPESIKKLKNKNEEYKTISTNYIKFRNLLKSL